MRGFAWIIAFLWLGERIAGWIPAPLPGNVIGLLLLLLALHLKWVKLAWVKETADFLLSHMMLFFAPVIVGTMVFVPEIMAHIWSITAALTFGTLAVLAVTGWVSSKLAKEEPALGGKIDDANS